MNRFQRWSESLAQRRAGGLGRLGRWPAAKRAVETRPGLIEPPHAAPTATRPAAPNATRVPALHHPRPHKIVSWNLLRRTGAAVADVVALIEQEQPDLLLMQEATRDIAAIADRVGGVYAWAPLPGRIHGLAIWSRRPWGEPPAILALPSGAVVHRVCQVLDLGDFGIANVHLSHGQMLNRRQLRHIERALPPRAAVLGDYNIVGPALLPGFRDVGPRHPTHAMVDVLPLRLDRCLVRGLNCHGKDVLPRGASDHRPIVVHLTLGADEVRRPQRSVKGMAAAVGRLRRGTAPGASVP
ncbi:endonuclease/exonuclease/phosphatase family protein [Methylobacterium durans]|uniref:endonuclease/exonuclease/phosphatase family protein n=1 Tax=Methylobacterium durans TaxID=2202825 RepID=UPI002AFFD7CB|nr:endonuclease/exonuclease/phosphatase family protein [Methylobacterium durans]MEA1830965.1 endonuclease/exonuclease/phosphatase family protein [Methylobacterium durans]